MSTPRDIVFVTPVLPWPADQGARRFQLEAARALATVGPVTWITRTLGDQADAEAMLREEGFTLRLDRSFASRSPWARARRRVRIDAAAAWRREPRELHFVSSDVVRRLVREEARRRPDAWFVGAYWSTVRALDEAPRGRRVLLAADVESDAARKGLDLTGTDRASRSRVRRLRRAEVEAFSRVDDLLCLTGDDERTARDLLEEAGTSFVPRIGRWPVGLPLDEACSWPPAGHDAELLLYGHWEAGFNRDGLDWFLREIWPAVRRRHPQATVRIVGRGVEGSRLAVEGITWVGYVDDLRAELERCRAVLIPLRFAGGLRYRLVEALGSGRPVVCTPVAAAGAEAQRDRTHLEAEGPEEWVMAIGTALDPVRATALRDAGRAWAIERHGLDASRAAVRDVFDGLESSRGDAS